jgi:hypothetical protein
MNNRWFDERRLEAHIAQRGEKYRKSGDGRDAGVGLGDVVLGGDRENGNENGNGNGNADGKGGAGRDGEEGEAEAERLDRFGEWLEEGGWS